jgi:acetyl-CoA acetyltransferase
MTMKAMREVAIVGIGQHPWGQFPEKSMQEMGVEATVAALKDANMSWRDIQSAAFGAYMWIADRGGVPSLLMGTSIARMMGETGIPMVNCVNACASGQAILREAVLAVASGHVDNCIAIAADKSAGGFFRPQLREGAPTKFDKGAINDTDYVRFCMTGETNPAYWAMELKRRMHDVGTTDETLAYAKHITSVGSVHNPYARYRKVFTIDEIKASKYVAEPLRLFEICATSDGACAVIVTTMENAKKFHKNPLWIKGIAIGTPTFGDPTIRLTFCSSFPRPGVLDLSESRNAIKAVYQMSGLQPADIDIIELPDNSSWHYLVYLECIMQLMTGEADKILMSGKVHPIEGDLPVCSGGGLAAQGEAVVAQGLSQVCQLVRQMRGECGEGQVKKTKLVNGLAQTYGYAGNNAACILQKAW